MKPQRLPAHLLACALGLVLALPALAADPAPAPAAKEGAVPSGPALSLREQVREAIKSGQLVNKQLPVVIRGDGDKTQLVAQPATARPPAVRRPTAPPAADTAAEQPPIARARRAALTGHAAPAVAGRSHEVHWSYAGETGPEHWARLSPEYKLCAHGRRQSPIAIESAATLQGPAEALQFSYQPSPGTVVHNGHTIQVDVGVEAPNTLTVRGSAYRLVQLHFHHPAEERIDGKSFAMVAHLVHRNAEGQLAVLAVMFEPGAPNRLIHKVWTYMPLDAGDRVRMPPSMVDLNEILPQDQRYYQFMGSLTTPPCTEGVLWLVLKQPVSISPDQLRLFSQLFPHNARPPQPTNGRPVREAL